MRAFESAQFVPLLLLPLPVPRKARERVCSAGLLLNLCSSVTTCGSVIVYGCHAPCMYNGHVHIMLMVLHAKRSMSIDTDGVAVWVSSSHRPPNQCFRTSLLSTQRIASALDGVACAHYMYTTGRPLTDTSTASNHLKDQLFRQHDMLRVRACHAMRMSRNTSTSSRSTPCSGS